MTQRVVPLSWRKPIKILDENRNIFLIIFLSILLSACSADYQGDQRLSEVAKIDIEAQNQNLGKRAEDMELDLARRQGFYQGVRGQFEGEFTTKVLGNLKIRITILPTITPLYTRRTRLPEEIAEDLKQLSFNIQIIQWDPNNLLSASGCRIEGVRPDLKSGQIQIISKDCPNGYLISIADSSLLNIPQIKSVKEFYEVSTFEIAPLLATKLLLGTEVSIPEITGSIQMTTNAETYYFKADRLTL